MTGGVCYKPGRERGAWYELKTIRDRIAGLEAQGEDASFERELYTAWLKDPEFSKADDYNRGQGFYGGLTRLGNKREVVTKIKYEELYTPANFVTSETPNVSPDNATPRRPRGRPRKQDGEPVTRMTEWRRKKEAVVQGVLI